MNSSEPDFPDVDEQSLPVNLHFPDQRVLAVDIDSVMRRGLRMRRNRKVLAGAAAAAAVGVLGVSAACLAPSSSPNTHAASAASSSARPRGTLTSTPSALVPALSAFERSDVVRQHPPVGGRITLIGSRPNAMAGFTMSAVAWASGGRLFYGFADLNSSSNNTIMSTGLPAANPSNRPTLLSFHVVGDTDPEGYKLAIGFVSGAVTSVGMQYQGGWYSANVVSVSGVPPTGAYMMWLSPAGSATPGDDAQLVGYDAQGHAVAR